MRILLIEDYDLLRQSLEQGLREEGYAVDAARDGETGLWQARSGQYDVIVLDLMLPKVDGLSILKKLREENSPSHVLILTAKDSTSDRINGLDAGADDYLVKPFALGELLARVRALVRRKYDAKSPLIQVGDLQIDTASRSVSRGGERVELSAREYALLEFMAHRIGQVVTRTEIWDHVYDDASTAESNVVDVFIGHLRKKIERDGLPRLIHTRRGIGYQLGEVRP
jgi:DNA-binding response OmpR family regulator